MGISTVANLLKDKAEQSAGRYLISVSADLAVADAVSMMVENGISSVIVLDAGEFIGLITQREFFARPECAWRATHAIPLPRHHENQSAHRPTGRQRRFPA